MTRLPLIRSLAAFAGIVFVLVGICGFIPRLTTHVHELRFAGHGSATKLFGTFQVSVVHNLVHLLFGVVGLGLARSVDGARRFLAGGGVVYLTLWVVGVIGAGDWIPVNTADNWLHFLLGIGMLAAGFAAVRVSSPTAT